MANDYIKRLKANLEGYNSTIKSLNLYYENDKKNYIGEKLESRKIEYEQKKALARQKIETQIIKEFNSVKETISKLSFPNPSIMQTPEYQMFHNDLYEFSVDEVISYAEKAFETHNYTLLRAIQHYCDKHELFLDIPSPQKVITAYLEFYNRSLELVNAINMNSIGIDARVSCFADEGFASALYRQIGNCYFSGVDAISDTYAHSFDDVTLKGYGTGSINFDFVGVRE